MPSKNGSNEKGSTLTSGITKISVEGYKSLSNPCDLDISPMTILAGANSAGKSSALQPLLLLKQTLEVSYDTGCLLLNGDNVRLTASEQMFSRISPRKVAERFRVKLVMGADYVENMYALGSNDEIELTETRTYDDGEKELSVMRPNMQDAEISATLSKRTEFFEIIREQLTEEVGKALFWHIGCSKGFLEPELHTKITSKTSKHSVFADFPQPEISTLKKMLLSVIHIPGLRGNPERVYKTTGTGPKFPGTFENYVASIILEWHVKKDKRLGELAGMLEQLGLTSQIEAKQLDYTRVELLVGRLPHRGKSKKPEMVSITDVGFGVSQTLPIVVALLTAEPGQLVYIEQPEIHLHPNAQVAMAALLIEAANRGVQVIIETHSDIILLAIQALVAEGKIAPEKTQLHWFQRREEDGVTEVTSAPLDKKGSYGDWPEDFGKVALDLESKYLDAVEAIK